MINYKPIKKGVLSFTAVLFLLVFVFSPYSSAQTAGGQAIITWQANNYFPADFAGKSLPAPHTEVVASVELIQNNKLTDISGATIRWFLDDEFLKSGMGLKTVSFYTVREDDGYASIRVEITTKDGSFQGSLQIPVVSPEIVVSYRAPASVVQPNSQATFYAIPFSFSIRSLNDLAFFWSVNGTQTDTKTGVLSLNVGTPQTASQNTIQISVSAQNNLDPIEIAKTLLILPLQTSQ